MRIRHFIQVAMVAGALSLAGSAWADDPQAIIKTQQEQVINLLHQAQSGARDAQVNAILDAMVDYDQLAQRCFAHHWDDLDDKQKAEVTDLLRQLVEKSWRRNLMKTLDYDVSYHGEQSGESDGDQLVKTEAQSKTNRREPPVRVDYVMVNTNGWKVVDIVTEGSSLTANYGAQFHRMLTTDGEGYPYVVRRLKDKIHG